MEDSNFFAQFGDGNINTTQGNIGFMQVPGNGSVQCPWVPLKKQVYDVDIESATEIGGVFQAKVLQWRVLHGFPTS